MPLHLDLIVPGFVFLIAPQICVLNDGVPMFHTDPVHLPPQIIKQTIVDTQLMAAVFRKWTDADMAMSAFRIVMGDIQ